jgi:hypothetical protein
MVFSSDYVNSRVGYVAGQGWVKKSGLFEHGSIENNWNYKDGSTQSLHGGTEKYAARGS